MWLELQVGFEDVASEFASVGTAPWKPLAKGQGHVTLRIASFWQSVAM